MKESIKESIVYFSLALLARMPSLVDSCVLRMTGLKMMSGMRRNATPCVCVSVCVCACVCVSVCVCACVCVWMQT